MSTANAVASIAQALRLDCGFDVEAVKQSRNAWIFLSPEYAIKVRRASSSAVTELSRSGFQQLTLKEFLHGVQLCPDIYVQVLHFRASGLSWYALVMIRLAEQSCLRQQLLEQSISPSLGAELAQAFRALMARSTACDFDVTSGLGSTIGFIFRTLHQSHSPAWRKEARGLEPLVRAALKAVTPILDARREQVGFATKTHGDLRSDNVFLYGAGIAFIDPAVAFANMYCLDRAQQLSDLLVDLYASGNCRLADDVGTEFESNPAFGRPELHLCFTGIRSLLRLAVAQLDVAQGYDPRLAAPAAAYLSIAKEYLRGVRDK